MRVMPEPATARWRMFGMFLPVGVLIIATSHGYVEPSLLVYGLFAISVWVSRYLGHIIGHIVQPEDVSLYGAKTEMSGNEGESQ